VVVLVVAVVDGVVAVQSLGNLGHDENPPHNFERDKLGILPFLVVVVPLFIYKRKKINYLK
jgi:hypothetical protein